MKKIYLVFALLLSLLLINVVNAKEQYRLEFSTDNGGASEHVAYKEGYLFNDYMDGESHLIYYNKNGDIIKSKEYEGLYQPIVDGNDIFIRVFQNTQTIIARLDENLEIVKETPEPSPSGMIPAYISDYCNYICEQMIIKDNTVYYVDQTGVVYSYDKNLVEKENHQITESEILELFPELQFRNTISNLEDKYLRIHAVDRKDNYTVISKTEIPEKCQKKSGSVSSNYSEDCYISSVSLLNKQLNKIWETPLPKKTTVDEIRFVNNYIIAVANEYELYEDDEHSEIRTKDKNSILVYDMDGNLIQTINPDESFAYIEPSEYGFAVMDNECSFHKAFGSVLGALSEFNSEFDNAIIKGPLRAHACHSDHKVYSVLLNINTKVSQGKGKIKTIGTAKPGEPVTFVVTPDEGYILGEVKVTDSNGNVVVFKQNTFTMPDADVLVEATFLVKNAETKDIAITLVALLAVITGGLALFQYRRIKNY